jgi:hypothetical protein
MPGHRTFNAWSLKMISGRHDLSSLESPALRIEDDDHWQLVQRIVASRRFLRAPLLSRFLMHVCSETLQGRQHEITEYQIGVQVFERPRSYRTVEDNIVRNYARQLRRRLAEHSADEGKNEPYRIEIPLGGYVPVFAAQHGHYPTDEILHEIHPLPKPTIESSPIMRALVESSAETLEANSPRRSVGPSRPTRIALLLVYSIVLVGVTTAVLLHFQTTRGAMQPTSVLWASLFRSPLNTFVVPADSGFNILEDLSKRQVPLGSYLKGDYLALPLPAMDEHSQADLRTQEFTSFVDLQVVSAISRLPEVDPQRLFVRFPRDLRMDDLKTGNAILIGSIGSNPWAELAQRNLNFRIDYSTEMRKAWVENTNPRPGEAKHYESLWTEPAHPTYAVIAYQPNLAGTGHVLLIEGLDVAGTQAAADALLHGESLMPVLRAARQPNGDLRPFEVLLQSTSIESNAATTQVVASRIE